MDFDFKGNKIHQTFKIGIIKYVVAIEIMSNNNKIVTNYIVKYHYLVLISNKCINRIGLNHCLFLGNLFFLI